MRLILRPSGREETNEPLIDLSAEDPPPHKATARRAADSTAGARHVCVATMRQRVEV